jgi:hypothetical protein
MGSMNYQRAFGNQEMRVYDKESMERIKQALQNAIGAVDEGLIKNPFDVGRLLLFLRSLAVDLEDVTKVPNSPYIDSIETIIKTHATVTNFQMDKHYRCLTHYLENGEWPPEMPEKKKRGRPRMKETS